LRSTISTRSLDEIGDGEESLALRGGTQEHRSGAKGEVRAAGQNGVWRSDAHEISGIDLQAFLLEEAGVLSDKMSGEGEGQRRNGEYHLDFLTLDGGRAERGDDP
jgi:hypothetical protein